MLDYNTLIFVAIGSILGSVGGAVWYILLFRLKIWEAFRLRNLKRRTSRLRERTNDILEKADKKIDAESTRRKEIIQSLETEDEPARRKSLETELRIVDLEIEKLTLLKEHQGNLRNEIGLYDDTIIKIEGVIRNVKPSITDKNFLKLFLKSLLFALSSGLVIAASIEFVAQYTDILEYILSHKLDIVRAAQANVADNSEANTIDSASFLVGVVISGALFLLASAFLVCLCVVLFVSHTEQNMGRVGFAKDVVKTFGGFFAGILTTFLQQGM